MYQHHQQYQYDALIIAGATAADFSPPDNLRAFIAAGSNLYVWSAQDALKTISLTAPARDVSFSPEGAFAFVAGGSSFLQSRPGVHVALVPR